MVTKMRQMGPGMYSQSTQPCDDCDGAGEIINLEKRCKTCKGKKIKRDKKKIEQEIDKENQENRFRISSLERDF